MRIRPTADGWLWLVHGGEAPAARRAAWASTHGSARHRRARRPTRRSELTGILEVVMPLGADPEEPRVVPVTRTPAE